MGGSPLKEVLGVFGLVTALTFAVTRLRGIAPFDEYVHLAVGAFFLFGALWAAQRVENGIHHFGISVGGLLERAKENAGPFGVFDLARIVRDGFPSALREIAVALGIAAIVFPPFALGFSWWHGPDHAFVFRLPPDFASFAAAQVLVVGLPEEAFFRGFVQTRLSDHFGPSARRWLGVDLHVGAWLLQSVLFALIHFAVDLNPARLAVFFPGLLFGWLRAWRGGIGAPIAIHALSNIYSEILVRGWLR
ncbi:MAG: MrtC family glutamic-type intramembrane protease [Myxococcota bacterium]